MLTGELIALESPELAKYLRQHGLDKRSVSAIVEVFEELKRLRGASAHRPAQPGEFHVSFRKEENRMKVKLPAPPDPATTDPDVMPVSQHLSATVGDAEIFAADPPLGAHTTDEDQLEFPVDPGAAGGPGVDVTVSLTYTDATGKVSPPRSYTVHVAAPPLPPEDLPPNAPAEFVVTP
jgi:hypothetical protein